MIRLSPTTDSQTIKILPRVTTADTGLSLKITRDGTNKSETLTVDAVKDGHFMSFDATFSILKDNGIYSFEIYKNTTLWYRGKAYCTDSYDADANYTINNGKYTESDAGDSSQQYIFV